MPELDETIDIEINPDDLKIDTYRASGAGGQHINKTESAVRITHLPTGTVVASQAQRSQLKNREQAMGMLKAALSIRSGKERTRSSCTSRRTKRNRLGFTDPFLCFPSIFYGKRPSDKRRDRKCPSSYGR